MRITTDRGNKERRSELSKRLCICAHCPPNGGENRSGKRVPRCDKHKTRRKGR